MFKKKKSVIKCMKRGNKFLVVGLILVLLSVPFISAGFFSDWWGKITGEASATQPVTLNISISSGSAPNIYNITNLESITLTDGPNPTYVIINFSVSDGDGASNLDNTTAALNFTKSGEELRANSTCTPYEFEGNYANYTCNVTMWWWDAAGSDWLISANISDLNTNYFVNDTHTRTVDDLTGIVMYPSAVTFASILAGNLNTTPSDNLALNNTGNVDIASDNVQIKALDLLGETDDSQALWAGNFSGSALTGGDIECNSSTTDATALVNNTDTGIIGSILSAGNYTLEDGTAQEEIYLCLLEAGSELSGQYFSTTALGSWTVKIV
jgi:hypothetical protein